MDITQFGNDLQRIKIAGAQDLTSILVEALGLIAESGITTLTISQVQRTVKDASAKYETHLLRQLK